MESKQLYLTCRNREAAKMSRQRHMAQMKEQIKTPKKKELNEMEISNLSDAEFKILVIRMLKELSEDFNNFKRSNVHIIGVPEDKRKSKKLEIYLKK